MKVELEVIKALKVIDIIGITGKAGTGKSTLIHSIISGLIKKGLDHSHICIAAMTHNALRNLNFDNFDVFKYSIAKLLGKGYFSIKKSEYRAYKYIIIDECSMVSEQDYNDLLIRYPKAKLVFVGDIGQIGPIGGDFNVFTKVKKLITIDTNYRFANSPLVSLADMVYLKPKIPFAVFKMPSNIVDGRGYKFITAVEARDLMISEDIISVCYTNEFRKKVNYAIKKLKHPNTKTHFVGQLLIAYNNNIQEDIFNSQVIKVSAVGSINVTSFDLWSTFPNSDLIKYKKIYCYATQLVNKNLLVARTDCGSFNELIIVLKDIRKLINEKDWEIYKQTFIEFNSILLVDNAYCLTIHKAQGMTYDNTIVWLNDISKVADGKTANSLFYTAITRSKKITYIVK